jgi:hypothetical protein
MTTASATLLSDSGEHGIVNGLRITAQHCALNGIHARFHVFDDADDQREALFTPARWIVWDGHGWEGSGPGIGDVSLDALISDGRKIAAEALIVGCCWGVTDRYTDVIRRCLAAPVAYVGCEKRAGVTHGGVLFPPLLAALAAHAPGTDTDTLVAALREALGATVDEYSALRKTEWKAISLKP